jgi:hypothetical protein
MLHRPVSVGRPVLGLSGKTFALEPRFARGHISVGFLQIF